MASIRGAAAHMVDPSGVGVDGGLIYDVGMNNGDDTAYYLDRGFRVIAIEADPALCATARDRFSAAIAGGRLEIVNCGVAERTGSAPFWISETNSEWSAFDQNNARKGGGKARAITIETRTFRDILGEYGAPHYLKIDIEGMDRACVEALAYSARPTFVSIEMSHRDGAADLQLLASVGYRGFKCIRQNDLRAITPASVDHEIRIRRMLAALSGVGRTLAHARAARRRPSVGWRFPLGASGPFGDDADGAWLSVDDIALVWRRLRDVDAALGADGVGEWFDFHAAL